MEFVGETTATGVPQYDDNPMFLECSNSGVPVPPPSDHAKYDECYYFGGDSSTLEEHWTDDPAFWPTALTYGFTSVIGITGNALVMFALLADRKSRNVTSSFLVSLAVADLAFLLICIPYDTLNKLSIQWGGTALCKISGFVEMLSAAASVLNLTAVSVERYVVIVHPMKSRSWCTMGNTKRIIFSVWILAIGFSSPLLYIMDTKMTMYYNSESLVTTSMCTDSGLSTTQEHVGFAWYRMIVLFLVPVAIMVFCYTIVIHVLWVSTKQLARMTNTGESCGGDDDNQRLTSASSGRQHMRTTKAFISRTVKDHSAEIREARKQVIKMLLAIITVFFLCWGPKLVFHLMKMHEVSGVHRPSAFYTNIVVNLLPFIQSCTNPIIYSFMSKNFRRSMRNGCHTICHCGRCQSCCKRDQHTQEFDMESKSANGASTCPGRYSPSLTSKGMGRSYVTVMSDM